MLYNRPPGVQFRPAAIQKSISNIPAIKEKITEKKKLRKLWQTKRCPVLKNKLNRAIKTFKNLLNMKKNQEIQEYLSKLSATLETNYSLWKVRKRLKRPQIIHHS